MARGAKRSATSEQEDEALLAQLAQQQDAEFDAKLAEYAAQAQSAAFSPLEGVRACRSAAASERRYARAQPHHAHLRTLPHACHRCLIFAARRRPPPSSAACAQRAR